VYPLNLEQEMDWQPYFEDEDTPPSDHLWWPVALPAD
jgi:hypothetical protein